MLTVFLNTSKKNTTVFPRISLSTGHICVFTLYVHYLMAF